MGLNRAVVVFTELKIQSSLSDCQFSKIYECTHLTALKKM